MWTHLRTSLDPVSKYDVTIGNHVVCELETASGQDKTQFTLHFKTGQNCFKIFSHRQSWLIANSVHTANIGKTRQDCLVLSVSAVWTSHKTGTELSSASAANGIKQTSVKIHSTTMRCHWGTSVTILTYNSCPYITHHNTINFHVEHRVVSNSLPCNNSLLDVFQHAAVEVMNWY